DHYGVDDVQRLMVVGMERFTGERLDQVVPELTVRSGDQNAQLDRGERVRRKALVVLAVVIPELGRLPLAPPGLVGAIPVDRRPHAVGKSGAGFPAERPDAADVER